LLEIAVKVLILTSGAAFTSGGGIEIVVLVELNMIVVDIGVLLLLVCSEGLSGDSSDVSL